MVVLGVAVHGSVRSRCTIYSWELIALEMAEMPEMAEVPEILGMKVGN